MGTKTRTQRHLTQIWKVVSVSQTEAHVCSLCAFEVHNKTAVRKGNPVKWPKLASDMVFNFCGWTCVFLCSVEESIGGIWADKVLLP